jgi:hypothetical protein
MEAMEFNMRPIRAISRACVAPNHGASARPPPWLRKRKAEGEWIIGLRTS